MSYAIEINDLSKCFRLTERQKGYRTLSESITEAAGRFTRRIVHLGGGQKHRQQRSGKRDFWALRNVDFSVKRGESVGIIGANGAGKSTLLKLIGRILEPTHGQISVRGRLSCLLEVGTGFHHELSGRENIFLNGAILGMKRSEIQRQFDAIVEFAELSDFIDTPVKRYSSGMFVRLAFSVAAHLRPDILILDEVLSVGDLRFQRKCLEFTKALKAKRSTILFVSHNMSAVRSLCGRTIYMKQGQVDLDSPTADGIRRYEEDNQLGSLPWADDILGDGRESNAIQVTRLELLDANGRPCAMFRHGDRMRMRLHYSAVRPVRGAIFVVGLIRSDGVAVCNFNTHTSGLHLDVEQGSGVLELAAPPIRLVSERYSTNVLVWASDFKSLISAQQGPQFQVADELLSTEFGVYHEPGEWRQLELQEAAPSQIA